MRKFLNLLWPQMGWKRYGRYITLRLARLSDTNEEIARGLAHGGSISWTPLPGTHAILSAIISWMTKSSPYAAVIGSLIVGSIWTLPLMWLASYWVGFYIFGFFGLTVKSMPDNFTWNSLMNEIAQYPFDLFMPWLVGGVILMIITWPLFYFISLWSVKWARSNHKNKSKSKMRLT